MRRQGRGRGLERLGAWGKGARRVPQTSLVVVCYPQARRSTTLTTTTAPTPPTRLARTPSTPSRPPCSLFPADSPSPIMVRSVALALPSPQEDPHRPQLMTSNNLPVLQEAHRPRAEALR